jgi:hypothetical protein
VIRTCSRGEKNFQNIFSVPRGRRFISCL